MAYNLFGIHAAVVAVQSFDFVGVDLRCIRFVAVAGAVVTVAGAVVATAGVVVMMASALRFAMMATAAVVLVALPESVEQQECEHDGATQTEKVEVIVVAGVEMNQGGGEPFARHQQVNGIGKTYGCEHNGEDVHCQRAATHYLAYDEQRSNVAGGAHHEQQQGSTRRNALEHQGYSDRYAARGAKIHGENQDEHEENAQRGAVLKVEKEAVGHKDGDNARYEQTKDEPLANVLHHIDKAVAQGEAQFRPKSLGALSGSCGSGGVGSCDGFVFADGIAERTAYERCNQGCNGADNGEGQAHERVGSDDRVNAGLRSGCKESDCCPLAGSVAAQCHGCGDYATRAQGQRNAKERGVEHGAQIVGGEVFAVERVGDESVHKPC